MADTPTACATCQGVGSSWADHVGNCPDCGGSGATIIDYIEDGFGNRWPLCGPFCDLAVVRPGKAQCNQKGALCPEREAR